ncbi:MAG: HPP family protein [Haliscomenobacter sp.]
MDPNRPIREIMTTDLITISPDTSTDKISTIFSRHSFHHLPVVEKGDKLIGMVSKQDILKIELLAAGRLSPHENELRNILAKDIMTGQPLSLSPEDSIGLAADIFMANQFHALPILEDDMRLTGLITTHDLLMYCFRSPIPEIRDIDVF